MGLSLALLACSARLHSQTPNTSVTASAVVTSVKYCGTDAEIDSMQAMVTVTYRNVGDRPLLHFGGARVGSTEVIRFDAEGQAEVVWHATPDFIIAQGETDWNRLLTLAPTKTHSFSTLVWVPANRRGYTGEAGLNPGKYVLRLTLYPFPESERQQRAAAQKVSNRGALWTETTVVTITDFVIPEDRRVVNCR